MIFFSQSTASRSKGFTLLELLVSIAVLAVLAGVVMVSIKSSKGQSADTAVKRNLNQLRGAAATVYDATGTYDTFCDATTETGKLYRDAYAQSTKTNGMNLCLSSSVAASKCMNGLTAVTCAGSVDGNFDKWAVSIQLKGKTGNWYCVDYKGVIKEQAARGIDYSPIDFDC